MRDHRPLVAGAWIFLAATVLGSLAFAADPPAPPEPPKPDPPSEHGRPFDVPVGETHVGDVYRFATTVKVSGTQQGDLTVWSQSVDISGTVTGDLYAASQSVEITGTVGDSARIAASTVTVSGTVEGDLSIWAANVVITKDAHITGDLHCFAARCAVKGTIDGDLQATGGEVSFGGKVGKNASIKCDVLELAPDARIAGDLDYEAREKMDLAGKEIVAGSVTYQEKEEEEETEASVSGFGIFVWFWLLVAATVIGFLCLRLFEGPSRAVTDAVASDMLRSSGVGFLAVIVVPVAGMIACVLIITIPLVVILWFLYCLTLYFTQFPVAAWMGRRILGLFGQREPNRYLSLFVGLLLLYLLFVIPCVGWLVMFYAVFLGFGAILLGLRSYRMQRKAPPSTGEGGTSTIEAPAPAPVTT